MGDLCLIDHADDERERLKRRLAQAEAALQAEVAERRRLEEALARLEQGCTPVDDVRDPRQPKETLERLVRERTAELAQANAELQAEIQDRQRAEATARAERQRFNDILEVLPAYLVLLTPDYHVSFANRFFRERFGESYGRRCYEYLFERGEPCEICDTYKTLQVNAPLRWEWLGPDGHNYDVFDFPFTDTSGSTLILEMGLDVTEQKRAEQALRAAGAYNRSLIEASLDPLVTIGPDGKITDVNAATEAVTGVPRARLIGSDFSSYFTEPEQASAGYRQVLAEGQVRDYPLTIRHADGHTVDVLYNATVYRNEAGEVQGVFAAARDITERKRAEAELVKYRYHLEELVQERTAELEAANARLHAEIGVRQRAEAALERYLARLGQLLHVSQRVIAETTIDGLLQTMVDVARELLDARLSTSGQGYRDGLFRVSAASRDAGLPLCPEGEVFAIERGGVYLQLIEKGEALYLTAEQLEAHPSWWGLPPGHVSLRGLVGAPLIGRDGRPDGLIMVSDRREGEFTAEDQALLSQLAALASLAIQHVEAHAEAAAAAASAEQRAAELDAVFTSISSGMMFYGPDSRIVRINPAAQQILGYGGPLYDVPFAERVRRMRIEGADGRPMAFDQMPAARAFRGETTHGLPMALYVGGEEKLPTWVMASAAPVRTADGTLLGVVSTFSDVTELRRTQEHLESANRRLFEQAEELEVQAEELLSQNQELAHISADLEAERARLEVVLQRMPAGVVIAEPTSGKLTLYNEEMGRIWRYPFDAAAGPVKWPIGAGFYPDGRAVLPEEWPLARALSTGRPVPNQEFEIVRGDGTHGTVSIGAAPILSRSGQVAAAVTVVHDVTEHRELERALSRARDELATLLASSGDIASTLDINALLRIVADRLKQIVPYTGLVVYWLSEGAKTLEVGFHYGPAGEQHARLEPIPVDQAAGLEEVIATRRYLLIPDLLARSPAAQAWQVESHPVQQQLLGTARCWLAVPLAVQDRVIGLLRLTHEVPGRLTEHDAELTLALAQHIALAMENARLYQQARDMAAVEERQRLARDLHDAVSQTLFSASLMADILPRLWERNPDAGRQSLQEIRLLTRGALAEMRALLLELRPAALVQAKLGNLLKQLGEAFAAKGQFKIDVAADECCTLPPDVQVGLYRITQEALNNVYKHAQASAVAISLHCQGDPEAPAAVTLCISDDGCGFDVQSVPPERLGVRIMHERARAIGAEIEVDSHAGRGTRVKATWPKENGRAPAGPR